MLEFSKGAITETSGLNAAMVLTGGGANSSGSCNGSSLTSGMISYGSTFYPLQTYWQSYPVYICSDKTAKAIEVLKALQSEKLLKCDSVPRFIALVEKISNLL